MHIHGVICNKLNLKQKIKLKGMPYELFKGMPFELDINKFNTKLTNCWTEIPDTFIKLRKTESPNRIGIRCYCHIYKNIAK